MNWNEYEAVRDDVIKTVKIGGVITQKLQVARTHATLFNHKIRFPKCATSFLEMFFEVENEYKNQKGIK